MTLGSFLDMGGYAFYVWTSYGITTAVLLFNLLAPIVQRKQLLRQLALKQKRPQR
ncbi:heme exporter protein CcmD [Methylomonas lenta]|jgi:heme exporter protein D|uniref:Heme exporter protein D n=1 Tax=Methylomonas lenta TaxID=980561 RepID=A0A177N0F4_9GAMM|nr:heme exporter protein CcmD [Methylomonas lenta]OAI11448.1 heme exporter protein CcmD [Methylomonas lenta]